MVGHRSEPHSRRRYPDRCRHHLLEGIQPVRTALPGFAALAEVFRWAFGEVVPDATPVPGEVEDITETINGQQRHWTTYRPATGQADAPILLVLHGTGGNGADLRVSLGYRFDVLAEAGGFVVVYPDGWQGNWNEARKGGSFPAKEQAVDDTAFIRAIVDRTARAATPRAVWLSGHSSGGQMALRAGLEASELIDAVVASAACIPTPDNWQPGVTDDRARPVDTLLIVGDRDPVNPYRGGRVGLFGLLGNRGTVLSAEDSKAWIQHRNASIAPGARVELRVVEGNGHHFVVPGRRGPRLFGPIVQGVDLAEEAVTFLRSTLR